MAEDRMPFYEDPPGSGYFYSPDPRFPFPEELRGQTPRYLEEVQGEDAEERFRLRFDDGPDEADDALDDDAGADDGQADDWAAAAPSPASDPAPQPAPAAPAAPSARPSRHDARWERARGAYEAGVGVSDICRRFDVPRSSVYARRAREGWAEPVDALPAFDPLAAPPVLDDMRRMAVARLAHAIDAGLVSEVGTWLRACERMRAWRYTGVIPAPRPDPRPAPEPAPAAPAPVQADRPAWVDPAPAVVAPIPSATPPPAPAPAPIEAASVPPAAPAEAEAAPCDLDAGGAVRTGDAVRDKARDDFGDDAWDGADEDEPLMSVDEIMAQLDRAGTELQRAQAQLAEAGGAPVLFPDGHALAGLPDEMDRLDKMRTALHEKLRPQSGLDKLDTVRAEVSRAGVRPFSVQSASTEPRTMAQKISPPP